MERIGLLGGTFDPVHIGHLQLARGAAEEMGLDRVLLIPAADPPHKSSARITPYEQRVAMVRLALGDDDGTDNLQLCLIEGRMPTPSYTIDTVQRLQDELGPAELFFIIGTDAFSDLLSWKSYRPLLASVTLLVASRRGFSNHERMERIRHTLGYGRQDNRWLAPADLRDIVFLEFGVPEISSSGIRRALAAGALQVSGLANGVREYIHRHHIYSARNSQG